MKSWKNGAIFLQTKEHHSLVCTVTVNFNMTSKRCTSSCSLVHWTQVGACYGFVVNKFGSLTWRKPNASQRTAVLKLSKRNVVPVVMQVAAWSVRAHVATNKMSVSLMSKFNLSFIKYLVCQLKHARCPDNSCLHLRNTISLRAAKCQPYVGSAETENRHCMLTAVRGPSAFLRGKRSTRLFNR